MLMLPSTSPIRKILTGMILSILLFLNLNCQPENDPIYIALVAPKTGTSKANGLAYYNGIQLLFDQINAEGGIHGRTLKLEWKDDQNDPNLASQQALAVAKEGKFMAVIGHNYSSCSKRGGEIYKKYKIPAITPTSTGEWITLNNPWYFRVIFTNPYQATFLASYAHYILNQNHSTLIYDEESGYGKQLAAVFKNTADEIGMEATTYSITSSDNQYSRQIDEIIHCLEDEPWQGCIFLSMQAKKGIPMVKALRDAGLPHTILVPDSFASEEFQFGFNTYPKEQKNPGFYTNGIYVVAPLLFDSASLAISTFQDAYIQKYNTSATDSSIAKPNWRAGFSYDAAKVLVHALENAELSFHPNDIAADRSRLRNYIAHIDSKDRAIKGVTGNNYFDENGDLIKPISLGIFQKQQIITAMTQLQFIHNPRHTDVLKDAIAENRILHFGSTYMYKTNIVYTGIEILSVTDFDIDKKQCQMEFNLWFRYKGNIPVSDIEFSNALEPVEIGEPEEKFQNQDLTYCRYTIKGVFQVDFLAEHHAYGSHVVGLEFQHNSLSTNNLEYVIDLTGMGLTGNEFRSDQIQAARFLNPNTGWRVENVTMYIDTLERSNLGHPEFMYSATGMIDYSRFTLEAKIRKYGFTIRDVLPFFVALIISVASMFILAFFMLLHRANPTYWILQNGWFFVTLFVGAFLLSTEVVVLDLLGFVPDKVYYQERATLIWDVFYWFLLGFFINRLIQRFVWMPFEQRTESKVPRFLRRFISFIVYLLILFIVLAFVFDQKITSLLATSGLFVMIIGLAVQMNLANIFSGIAVNLERPFRLHDWVKIGSYEEGEVVHITWRTTRIRTRSNDIISIPNHKASESIIENYYFPDMRYKLMFDVLVDSKHNPERVLKVLTDAVLSAESVLEDPPPRVFYKGVHEWSSKYFVTVYVMDFEKIYFHQEAVWQRIWIHIKRAGMEAAIQRQELYMFRGKESRGIAVASQPLTILKEIELFNPFSDEDKQYLADHMVKHDYKTHDVIVRQNDAGDSLFIITEGVVSVRAKTDEGHEFEAVRMGAGDFFGERALLTGEPRGATVIAKTETLLLEITKPAITPLLEKNPGIAEKLSKILVERELEQERQRSLKQVEDREKDSLIKHIQNRITQFFGFSE